MDHFRKSYANLEESTSESVASILDDGPDQEVAFENVELVHRGLGQLGQAEREVLTLFFLEDWTLKEIAELLGVAVGTIKSRLFKARRDLRRGDRTGVALL